MLSCPSAPLSIKGIPLENNFISILLVLNLLSLAGLHREPKAYLKRSRVCFLGLEPVLSVYGGDRKNTPTVGIEPLTSLLLGRHHIHYTMATDTFNPYINEAVQWEASIS